MKLLIAAINNLFVVFLGDVLLLNCSYTLSVSNHSSFSLSLRPDSPVPPAARPRPPARPHRGGSGPASHPAAGGERRRRHRPTLQVHRLHDGFAVRPLPRRRYRQAHKDRRHCAPAQVRREPRPAVSPARRTESELIFRLRNLILVHLRRSSQRAVETLYLQRGKSLRGKPSLANMEYTNIIILIRVQIPHVNTDVTPQSEFVF